MLLPAVAIVAALLQPTPSPSPAAGRVDVSVSLSGPVESAPGMPVRWTGAIRNVGDVPLSGLAVTATYSPGGLSDSPVGWICGGFPHACRQPPGDVLEPGEQVGLVYTALTPLLDGSVSLRVSVSVPDPLTDANPSDNTASTGVRVIDYGGQGGPGGSPDLPDAAVHLAPARQQVPAGGTMSWTGQVSNRNTGIRPMINATLTVRGGGTDVSVEIDQWRCGPATEGTGVVCRQGEGQVIGPGGRVPVTIRGKAPTTVGTRVTVVVTIGQPGFYPDANPADNTFTGTAVTTAPRPTPSPGGPGTLPATGTGSMDLALAGAGLAGLGVVVLAILSVATRGPGGRRRRWR